MATAKLTTPEKLSLAGDTEQEWRLFKQKYELYMLASGLNKKPDDVRVALLLTLGGDELLRIYNATDFGPVTTADGTTTDPSKVLDTVLSKLDNYFAPRKLIIASRYKFRCCKQNTGETLDTYMTRLKTLSKHCDFGSEHDNSLRDQLVFGCHDDKLRERFLREENLSLVDALSLCQAYEASKKQMSIIKNERDEGTSINKVQRKFTEKPKNQKHSTKPKFEHHSGKATPVQKQDSRSLQPCKYCGNQHIWDTSLCPAYGKICSYCKKKNHFRSQCDSMKKATRKTPHGGRLHAISESNKPIDDTDTLSDSSSEYIMKVNPTSLSSKGIFAKMLIGENIVKFQIDSGASVNVLPSRYVSISDVTPYDSELQMWNTSTLSPIGKCRIKIRNCNNGKKYSVEFVIVKEDLTPLLGRKTSEQMKLISVNYDNICAINVFADFNDVFANELGKLPGIVHMSIDDSISPVAIPTCRVPISLKAKVKSKLHELEEQKVIQKVEEPTSWVSRMVVASKKSGDIRLCIDPQQLNKALKRELHPLPIMDDVLPELSNAKVFSRFDLRNGYWQCILDEESSKLTTFQTPFGRYRWLRLPFGLAISSEIFQKKLQFALDGIPGVICVADDVLVYGKGENEKDAMNDHDYKLKLLLERCRMHGIRLNSAKVELRKSEITFLGHKVTASGLKPDPTKIESIVKMPAPANVNEILKLNGMVNYLAKFMPKLSNVMEPIRRLTKKDVEWIWTEEHSLAFQKIKSLVTKAPVLSYFDPNKQLQIQCDASQSGLGAVLLQDGNPLFYASRALTPTERRYAQIEKEMLAIVFSLKKFHQYTFGRKTIIYSDHKPLKSIFGKPLCRAPKRLQGMMLSAQQYDFELEYTPGKEMYVADVLSRAYLDVNEGGNEFEAINMVSYLPIRNERLNKIREATRLDDTLQHLTNAIVNGWPEHKNSVHTYLIPYFDCRDEFTVQDGLIFKGERVVIPSSLRKEIKEAVHSSHIGIEGCLRRARECIFWPGMNSELKEYMSKCEVCNKYKNSQQKESLMSHELSDRPWEKVGVDIFELKGQFFLVTVDYYSNFWEIDRLESTKSSSVIRKLRAHFARYGSPSVLISDCGSQFTSEEFYDFIKDWDIEHRTTSPKHSQSNGMAESAVKMAKRLVRKAVDSNKDPYFAILDYRNTPTQGTDFSPAQRNLGRRTRTLLPTSSNLLKPKEISNEHVKQSKKYSNLKSSLYYNKGSKDLDPLCEGDTVRIKPTVMNKKTWEKGTVLERLDERSYNVSCDSGVIRRNRVHLRKSNESDCENAETSIPVHDNEKYVENNGSDSPNGEYSVKSNIDLDVSHNNQTYAETQNLSRNMRSARYRLPSKFDDYIVN